jgi:molecular chaperone DnaK (HSP70)
VRAVPAEQPELTPVPSLRLGVDFGTSTTQVAVYVGGRAPELLRLEDLTGHMPSYFALDPDGNPRFGATAMNLPENVHSVKPLLADDVEIEGFGHPSKLTFLMLEEVVRRTVERLREQHLIPTEIDRLELATNLGCTPRFELDARVRLRDVAQRAGLHVRLVSLIEEPVAAAYEILLSGVFSDGRILVVDMGGGTLDVAVVRISNAARRFELYASGGTQRAGDSFTEVVVDRIKLEILDRHPGSSFSRADETLIWLRADTAKQDLSIRRSAVVPLGGIAGISDETIELTREWFERKSKRLQVLVKADVTNIYRLARLVLDRGGEFDPAPGTVDFEERKKGRVRRLTEVPFEEDASAHIDSVVLVGGATNMPMIKDMFVNIFGAERVVEPDLFGIDRSAIVALGLSRPKPKEIANLHFPSWGISARFSGIEDEVPLYEPYAPTFHMGRGMTSTYAHEIDVPAQSKSVALTFRPIGEGSGVRWPSTPLPDGTEKLTFEMDLFGAVRLSAHHHDDLLAALPGPPRTPWSPPEGGLPPWLPPWEPPPWWTDVPTWDLRNDK